MLECHLWGVGGGLLLILVAISLTRLCSCKETCWPTDDLFFYKEWLKIDGMNVAATVGPDNHTKITRMHKHIGHMKFREINHLGTTIKSVRSILLHDFDVQVHQYILCVNNAL